MTATADELLAKVHARLKLGVDIHTFADGHLEVRWRRDYDGEWSDERYVGDFTLCGALQAILDMEDAADAEAAGEEAE